MRRVAATTLTVGTVIAAMAATAAPAQAASSFTTTSSKGAFKNVKVSGVFSRSSSGTTVRFSLTDYEKDSYTACAHFRFEESGQKTQTDKIWLKVRIKGKEYYFDGEGTLKGIKVTSPNSGHAYVRECAISKKTKRTYYSASWKKLF